MLKKVIITLIVMVVIAGGGFWYVSSESEQELQNFANSTGSTTELKTYTIADVSQHATASDCWMVIDNDVLDVTSFISKHPGGNVITEGCGKDATSYFKGVREHVKPLVKAIYTKLIIGKLATS